MDEDSRMFSYQTFSYQTLSYQTFSYQDSQLPRTFSYQDLQLPQIKLSFFSLLYGKPAPSAESQH